MFRIQPTSLENNYFVYIIICDLNMNFVHIIKKFQAQLMLKLIKGNKGD